MNYYPNYYQNYPYLQQSNQMYQRPDQQYLNGKIVDSEDVVRISEVPFGGYGVFPRADMKAIYVKSWNQDGTTRIQSYMPIESSAPSMTLEDLAARLDKLESKIDELKGGNLNESTTNITTNF